MKQVKSKSISSQVHSYAFKQLSLVPGISHHITERSTATARKALPVEQHWSAWPSNKYLICTHNSLPTPANDIPTGNEAHQCFQIRANLPPDSGRQRCTHETPLAAASLALFRDKNLLGLTLQSLDSIPAHSACPWARELPQPPAGPALGAASTGRRDSDRLDGPAGSTAATPGRPPAAPRRPTVVLVVSPVQHGSGLCRDRTGQDGRGALAVTAARFEGDGRRRPDARAPIRRLQRSAPAQPGPGPPVPVLGPSAVGAARGQQQLTGSCRATAQGSALTKQVLPLRQPPFRKCRELCGEERQGNKCLFLGLLLPATPPESKAEWASPPGPAASPAAGSPGPLLPFTLTLAARRFTP